MVVTTKQIQQKVVTFATQKIGQKVGSGECFDLADEALAKAGGKTASDYAKVTPTADYVWGDLVATAMAQPGDILQFRDYELKVTTTTLTKVTQGKNLVVEYHRNSTKLLSRPHHTAIVIKGGARELEILEQNVERGIPGVKDQKVGPETIPHAKDIKMQTVTKQVTVDQAWGNKVKKYFDIRGWSRIDDLTKHYMSKHVTEKVKVTVKVEVTGIIKAFRPKPK